MDNNIGYKIGEQKIWNFLEESCKNNQLLYVQDFGYREFYSNGKSFGICSNLFWKKKKILPNYNKVIADFYSGELLRLKYKNQKTSIRTQGQRYHRFLEIICNHGLGNVLVIHKFFSDKICAYYFIADSNDHHAINNFFNDSTHFHNIINKNQSTISKIVDEYLMYESAVDLLPTCITQEIFHKSDKQYSIMHLKKVITFSKKQSEILSLLAAGNTRNKAISNAMNIHLRTVEWHMQILKKKTNFRKKADLIELAKKIVIEKNIL